MRACRCLLLFPLALAIGLVGCQSKTPSAPTGDRDLDGGPVAASPVAAVVNGIAILERDLEASVGQAERSGGTRLPEAERARLRDQLLKKWVQDELLVQHARELGLTVSDEEVDRRHAQLKDAGGGEAAFASFVDTTGLDPARLRANLARNLLIERLMERLKAEIRLTEAQLREYHASHTEEFTTQGSMVIAHIAFGPGAQALTQAKRVRTEIQAGRAFGEAASRYSQDPASKDKAGLLGEFAPDDLLWVYAQALADMAPGDVSKPLQAPDGFHLLHLVSRTARRLAPFEEVQDRISQDLAEAALEQELVLLATRLTREAHVKVTPRGQD